MSSSADASAAPLPEPDLKPREYAVSAALRMRLLGTGLVAIGLVVGLVVLVAWLADLPRGVVSGLVVLAVLAVLGLGLSVGLRHWVVRLDTTGYRVRFLRSAQTTSARWSDVEDVQAATIDNNRCVLIRLRDGRTSTIAAEVLDTDPDAFARTIRAFLDAQPRRR